MKQKGFTLIELLAVIIILSVIILIVAPKMVGTTESAKKRLYSQQVSRILTAAKAWEAEHVEVLPDTTKTTNKDDGVKISVKMLKKGGYLKNEDIVNPIDESKKMDDENSDVRIYYDADYKQYVSIFCDKNDEYKYMEYYYLESDELQEAKDFCKQTNLKEINR